MLTSVSIILRIIREIFLAGLKPASGVLEDSPETKVKNVNSSPPMKESELRNVTGPKLKRDRA